jgi:hypothetical protein
MQAGRHQVRIGNLMDNFNRQLVPMALQHRFSRVIVSQGALDMASVSRALLHCQTRWVRIGALAVQIGVLTGDQVAAVRVRQAESEARFGEIAVETGLLDTNQLASLLAVQHEAPRDLAVVLARLVLLDARCIQTLLDRCEVAVGVAGRQSVLAQPPGLVASRGQNR